MAEKYSRDLRPFYLIALILVLAAISGLAFGFFTGATVLFLGIVAFSISQALNNRPKAGPMKHAYIAVIILAILFYLSRFSYIGIFSEYMFVIVILAILGIIFYISYASTKCPRCGSRKVTRERKNRDYIYRCSKCGNKWSVMARYLTLTGTMARKTQGR